MKVLLCVLALALSARGQVDTSDIEEFLPHFDLTQLDENFKEFETFPSTCTAVNKQCAKGGHEHAQTCIGMFFEEKGDDIRECVAEHEGLAQASQDWQEASLTWHKNIQSCLNGDDAPAAETENDVYFLFKRQASQYDCEEEDESHSADEYEDGKACFVDFKTHKTKCLHCVKQDTGCAGYLACTGRGARPEDARLQGWWTLQAKLGREKKNKIKKAKKMIFTCLGLKPEAKRRRLRMRRLRRH